MTLCCVHAQFVIGGLKFCVELGLVGREGDLFAQHAKELAFAAADSSLLRPQTMTPNALPSTSRGQAAMALKPAFEIVPGRARAWRNR